MSIPIRSNLLTYLIVAAFFLATALRYSTFVGGSSFDYAYDVTLSDKNEPIVVGWTESNDFPTTNDAYDGTHNGGGSYNLDGYWLRLAADGTMLRYSSFIGGADDDYNQAVQLSNEGDVLMTGYTASSDFPTSAGAYDSAYHSNNDLFVMRFGESISPTPTPTATASHTPSPSATSLPNATPTSSPSPTASPTAGSQEPIDQYEPDDNCKDALPIQIDGTIQTHTFHQSSDEDWLSFPVQQGETYMIEGRVPPEWETYSIRIP